MKARGWRKVLPILLLLLVAGAGFRWYNESSLRFSRLLVEDGALSRSEPGTGVRRLLYRLRSHRVESGYRRFLEKHPDHARAMVAYGCFLYDQHREEEAVDWWKKAIATDPELAVAYNNLGEHYSHNGGAAEALKLFDQARTLQPNHPVFQFNWAITCSLYREDSRRLYGWDTEEIFRQSLDAFRRARDLAPLDYTYSSAYAQTFYWLPQPDWPGAYEAWRFCLSQPIDEVERQRICGYLARVCMHLQRIDESRSWLERMTAPEVQSLRAALGRKLLRIESAGMTETVSTSDAELPALSAR